MSHVNYTNENGGWVAKLDAEGKFLSGHLVEPSQAWYDKQAALPPTPQPEGHEDVEALAALPDPSTWTNAQLKEGVVRLLRIELRRRGLL